MRHLRVWIWSLIAIALFAGGFAYTYSRLSAQDMNPQINGEHTAVERLDAQASILLKHVLADGRIGGEERYDTTPVELVGATLDELYSKRPTWSVVTFSADQLVAEVRCADYKGGYLGVSNGRVAVFEGSGHCSVLREQTDIPLESIHPDERVKLAEGSIRYDNDDHLQELLDGLAGD